MVTGKGVDMTVSEGSVEMMGEGSNCNIKAASHGSDRT